MAEPAALPPEIVQLLRDCTAEFRGQRAERAELSRKIDVLVDNNARQDAVLEHLLKSAERVDKYVFTGNGTKSVLSRLDTIEKSAKAIGGLLLALLTTAVGAYLTVYLGGH